MCFFFYIHFPLILHIRNSLSMLIKPSWYLNTHLSIQDPFFWTWNHTPIHSILRSPAWRFLIFLDILYNVDLCVKLTLPNRSVCGLWWLDAATWHREVVASDTGNSDYFLRTSISNNRLQTDGSSALNAILSLVVPIEHTDCEKKNQDKENLILVFREFKPLMHI